jgi:hypothetical protein
MNKYLIKKPKSIVRFNVIKCYALFEYYKGQRKEIHNYIFTHQLINPAELSFFVS